MKGDWPDLSPTSLDTARRGGLVFMVHGAAIALLALAWTVFAIVDLPPAAPSHGDGVDWGAAVLHSAAGLQRDASPTGGLSCFLTGALLSVFGFCLRRRARR